MVEVAATTFVRNFGRYKTAAQREPVAVTSHGRTEGYFISAADYEEFQALLRAARKSCHPSELPADLAQALELSMMDRRHDHLDMFMDKEVIQGAASDS